MDVDHEIRLDFSYPIVNQPGPDLYLAQAQFLSNRLGFGSADVNGFGLKFDKDPTSWRNVSASDFKEDAAFAAKTIYYTDGSVVESEAYRLWFATVDLSDFGYGLNDSIDAFNVRGADVGIQEDEKLDIVTIANLNAPAVVPLPPAAILFISALAMFFPYRKINRN